MRAGTTRWRLTRQHDGIAHGGFYIQYLLPEYQGLGLGTRLMKRFEAHRIDQGVTGVHLQTSSHNHKAIPFYKKLGFIVVNQVEVTSHSKLDNLQFLTFAKKLDVAQEISNR